MSIRTSHGKARTELPRSSDLKPPETDATPTQGRGTGGRFAPGNSIASGNRWKAAIAESLGAALDGDAGKLGREAHRFYRAFLGDLPSDKASVRQLVASRALAAVLATHFARRAAEVGLDTDAGAEALKQAAVWDQRAERLAVTSWDLATKMAGKRKVIDAHARVLETFGVKRP
jgi:hypothetical protein